MRKYFLICLMTVFFQTTVYAETFEWTAGQFGGGWYTMTAGLTKLIEESEPDIKIRVVLGGGTTNPSKVNKGKSQFGLGLDVLAFLAKEGKDIYEGKDHKNIMMIGGSLSDNYFHFVKADGAKYSLEQLFKEGKNARVGVTMFGSSDEKIFSWIMQYYGTSYEDLKKRGVRVHHANYVKLSNLFRDRLIDYVFVNLGLPGAAVTDMLLSRRGSVYPLPEAMMKDFGVSYGYTVGIIRTGNYKGLNNDVATGKMGTIILVNRSVSEDVVYKVTRAICENQANLTDIHESMTSYKCPTAIKDGPIPVHPGALKYYKELGYVE